MMSSREILEFITGNEKITLSKLSQLMGIKRAQPLYDIRDGKIKAISANYADKILSVFPKYSRAWLITGEGQPFSKKENEENVDEDIIVANNKTTERFHEVMDSLNLNDYKVYTSIEGISKNMMSKLRQGHTEEVSAKILMSFCEAYPQVNANYILTGKGDMFLNNEYTSSRGKEGTDEIPSPESAEYWRRMYESTVVTYEAMLDDLEKSFNALDKSCRDMQEFFEKRENIV